ncbi:MAG: phosphatase PAP2 family protein [Clostridia bacterium]|nr:phosphatase PAP2 family protein [Clostridia bacterium]
MKEVLKNIPERVGILFFWPIFGAVFWSMELIGAENYHNVYCFLDDKIPFCEYFVIPYYFWFIFLIGMMVYGFFWDETALRNYMKFTAITYTVTLFIYAIYPTAQNLRPMSFENNNFCTQIVKFAYKVDTNTNVCPSIHVLGSMAVYFATRKSRVFGKKAWRITFFAVTVLITLSTLFVKQHSVLDVVFAVILGIIAYPFVYKKDKNPQSAKAEYEYINQ